MLFFLWLLLPLGSANNEVSSDNDNYPPLWDLVSDNLVDFRGGNGKCTINPWNYLERQAMYKILLKSTGPFLYMNDPDNKGNPLWGLSLQHGWQYRTGRLQDTTKQPSSGQNSKDQTSISTKSWWACMNYYLAVIPFLGAMDAGLFEGFSCDIVIARPDEFQTEFCCSIEECRSISPEVMNKWKTFFQLIMTLNQISDMSASPSSKEDKVLSYMWRAHVESISVAFPRCLKRLSYLSRPEGTFGNDWAKAVEFIADTNFPTTFQSTNEFQQYLPPRMLRENDNAPFISDFTEQENRVLFIFHSINQYNTLTGGSLLKLWEKAMCSEQGKAEGRNLLRNMAANPELVPETVIKIMIEMAIHFNC